MNQKNLCQRNGIRVYTFNSCAGVGKSDPRKSLDDTYKINLLHIKAIKTEVERMEMWLNDNMQSLQDGSQTSTERSILNPRNACHTSFLNQSRQNTSKLQNIQNPANSSRLYKPTAFKSVPLAPSAKAAPTPVVTNSFRQPLSKPNIQTINRLINASQNSSRVNTSHALLSASISRRLDQPVPGFRNTGREALKNSIPKPNITADKQPTRIYHPTPLTFNRSNAETSIPDTAHCIASSELPLGTIETMLTPIHKSRTSAVTIADSAWNYKDEICKKLTSNSNVSRNTTDAIKKSQQGLRNLKEMDENADPQLLEQLGDMTLAECYALLGKSSIQ